MTHVTLTLVAIGVSVVAGFPSLVNPCLSKPFSAFPFCNSSLGIDDRVADAVSRLTPAEQFSALGTATNALPSLGLNAYNWWSEATHGISHVNYDTQTPFASNVALPITTGCAFNRSLWFATGNQIGREGRAFMNAGNAYSTFWAPVINVVREPRWGRNIETPGEDPLLTGQYAINFVKGMQQAPEDPYHIQASACCKHYVANELENWNGSTRHTFNAVVTDQDLQDTYLPPFADCVQVGQVSGIMCSYNEVNGVPSCANNFLLQTVLRDNWEFDGYVTSDCDADGDVYNTHHYTRTPEETVRDVLQAGTDVDCGGFVTQNVQSALSKGIISQSDIDAALKRLFRVRMRLGHFDVTPLDNIGTNTICSAAAKELAVDGVRQSAVLLKNIQGTLPATAATIASAVVIGPNANLSQAIALYYGGQPCDNMYFNMVDAVKQYVTKTSVVFGLNSVTDNSTAQFPAAVAAAAAADFVVMAIGQDGTIEHEAKDRYTIDIQDGQKALIAAVAAAAKKPIVVVILTGGAVDVSSLLSNPKVGAVLHVGQPSVAVLGVGDVIFGHTVPAGRMNQMTYPASFVNDVSMFDMNMRPGPSVWPPFTNPGRTYRFYTGTPVVPFGFGLSYTTFSYTVHSAAATVHLAPVAAALRAAKPDLRQVATGFFVNVTNTGAFDAADVVLGFLTPPGAGQSGVPLSALFGFERVYVGQGQTVTVYLGAQLDAFTQVDRSGARNVAPGAYTVTFGVREAAAHGMGFLQFPLLAVV